jgi:hypothetical protein
MSWLTANLPGGTGLLAVYGLTQGAYGFVQLMQINGQLGQGLVGDSLVRLRLCIARISPRSR